MTLTAYQPFTDIPELVYVTSDALAAPANVVAKFNRTHNQLWRTNHAGERPKLADVRKAIAAL